MDILKEITDDPKKYHGFTKTGVLKEDLTIKAGKKRTRTFVVFDMLTEAEPIGSGENKIWHCSGDEWILQSMKNSGVKKGDTITVWGSLCICRDSIVYAPYFDFNIMLRAWKFADKERDKLRIPIEEGSPNYTEYVLST